MADNKNAEINQPYSPQPEDALDPQSAVAAQGLGQIGTVLGQQLESGPALSKAPMEGVEPEDSPIDYAIGAGMAKAAPSITDAIESGMSHAHFGKIIGNEVGQLGEKFVVGAGKQVKDFNPLKKLTGLTAETANQAVESNVPQKTFAEVVAERGKAKARPYADGGAVYGDDEAPEHPLKLVQKSSDVYLNPERVKKFWEATGFGPKGEKKKASMTEGDENYANGGYVNPDKTPFMAEGGDVPAGLDAFLAQPSSPQAPSGEEDSNAEPEGLNNFIAPELKRAHYEEPLEMAKTGAEGAAQGLMGPIAPALEVAAGVDPEDIRGRAEANPITHYGSEAAGLIAPALMTGGASGVAKLTQLGALEAIQKKIGLVAGETLASKIGTGAARAAIDNMLISGSDEVSKMILRDPNQSASTAMANVGLSGILGGAIGAALPAIPAAWNATVGDKTGKIISDFKARIQQHMDNPDPVASMTNELKDYHGSVTNLADEVYGPQGLKAQDIVKSMPEMSEKISGQSASIAEDLGTKIKKMASDPYSYPPRLVKKLQADLDQYASKATTEASPAELFNAAQDLKQQLQQYSKFDRFTKATDEAHDFVQDAKSLSHDIRTKLEDTNVWGDAAKRQQVINNAFREYLPTLKDFEKKFTVEVGGEKTIDPAKVQTYLNQAGSAKAEIKQSMLNNFLEASEKYKKVIDQSHKNLGLESPIKDTPMNTVMASFEKRTLGGKLADALIHKGLTDAGAQGLGAGIGATLAHAAGLHAGIGAIIGQGALAPFFKSVLPALAKSILDKETNPAAFRAAVEYGVNVAKGEAAINKATEALFKTDAEVLPRHLIPTEKHRLDLTKKLGKIRVNPNLMFNKVNPMQEILPEHTNAMNETMGNAITYLDQARPNNGKGAPLDSKPPMSLVQKLEHNNTLDLAQQPLLILDKVKKGTLTAKDLLTVSALYPGLLQSMQSKITESMTDHLAKGATIPYKTRLGMSMIMGTPMDSTMSQQAIFAAQPIVGPPNPQQALQPKKPQGTKSSPALQKLPNAYRTGSQSRATRAQNTR